MSKLVKLKGTVAEAKKELKKYPDLYSIFDDAALTKRINSKYPNGPEMLEDDFSDLFTALILAKHPMYQQASSNAATPGGALFNINRALSFLNLEAADKKALAVRLMNLKTSSLWDTLTEILLCETIAKNLTTKRVKLDYPLGKSEKKGHKPKDADVAMMSDSGQPMFLIDAITPTIKGPCPSALDALADVIERKYVDKFDAYCKTTGATNVVIAVSLLKSEILYMAFLSKLMSPQSIVKFTHPKLEALPGLAMAVVCSFRCPDKSTLVLDQIARYEKPIVP